LFQSRTEWRGEYIVKKRGGIAENEMKGL